MKFTLKEYQQEAVDDVLSRLGQSKEMYRGSYAATTSFSLTATTGAGKTVMAAAVLEALFEGDDETGFAADPTATVLWFTDDPSLNEQTRARIEQASDLDRTRLQVIETTFAEDRLRAGNVYFLNAQKLSRNSLLVRGAPTEEYESLALQPPPPDLRAVTFWEVLRNTIDDPATTLYLILDEAHRGMRRRTSNETSERQTIVRRLIDGADGIPPVPVVWGISATVKRFDDAMKETSTGRVHLPPVQVSAARVQESGLLKDDLRLDFPAEDGDFDTVLLARAARRTREADGLWRAYAASQDPAPEPVAPLLVVQVPNTPDDELLASAFSTVLQAWPELGTDAMAHVFGEHTTLELAGVTVPHISPEKVQESTWVRVLFAKDAVSTGWDCPRAEVLMSFRPAKDQTHITQLLGRMVRNPLARRIPGDDRLNAVECVLPRFNKATATKVGELLLGLREEEGNDDETGPRTLFTPVEMRRNADIESNVWDAFDAMPSHTLPRRAARPIRRLLALAQALSRDGLRAGARTVAMSEMSHVLDGLMARYRDDVDAAVDDVRTLSGETIVAGVNSSESFNSETFSEITDDRAVAADYAKAGRVLTRDLARTYADSLAEREGADDDALLDAEILVAALARIDVVATTLDTEAHTLAERWTSEHRVAIKALSDERRAAYDEIRAMATEPMRIDVQRPRVRLESSQDAAGSAIDTRPKHIMSGPEGFPIGSLNEWETEVLDVELRRADALAWYRNPSRPSPDALAVAYQDETGSWRRMCPDFVFFHGSGDDIRVAIVDPHGHYLGDTLAKLTGLAAFADEFGTEYHRIEALSKIDDQMRVLDLMNPAVRVAVGTATSPETLYREHGVAYK